MKKHFGNMVIILVCILLLCSCNKTIGQAAPTENKDIKGIEQSSNHEDVQEIGNGDDLQAVFSSSQIKSSYIADLSYHLFSYMNIGNENAANVYSEDYIKKITKIKKENKIKDTLVEDLKNLTEVFQKRFSSLEKIMFIPFYVSNFEEFKNAVLTHKEFTDEDITDFVQPFLEVMEKEQEFYLPYWENLQKNDKQNRSQFIKYLNSEFAPVQGLLKYKDIKPEIYLCYSMSKNGRGFDKNGSKCVAVLSPLAKEEYQYSFFFIYHELTHILTDPIAGGSVSTTDGAHDIIEKLVFLFDYYLLEHEAPEKLPAYLNFIRVDNKQITVAELEKLYKIPDDYTNKLHELVDTIVSRY